MTKDLKIGHKAPAFAMPTDSGGKISLKNLKGQIVVLYFYPKDLTPGCTKQAIAFSEHIKAFDKAGAIVIGTSKDPVNRHDKFKEKHSLAIILASDEDGHVSEDYGVWVEKNMYGRKFMGVERSTFLIDAKGVIHQIWRKVKVNGHAEEVLKAVQAL